MARNLTQLSATNLKELKKGESISVVHKDSSDGIAQVIASSFPKRVATNFATKWADDFPPLNKLKIGTESKGSKTSVVVIGGSKQIWQKIIAWMMSCCDGVGLRPFEAVPHDERPFSKYHTVRRHANDIGCKYLEDDMQRRLDRIGSQQVHSEDVRQLYLTLPRDSDDLRYLAKHVAIHILNNTLKSKSSYLTLRDEIPAFDEDVNAILDPMVEKRKAERQAEREERAETNRQRRLEGFHKRQWGDTATDINVDKEGIVHAKVTLPQVRQGHSGRPAQYRLDLAKIVDKQDYTRIPYRGAKSQRLPPEDENRDAKPAPGRQGNDKDQGQKFGKDAPAQPDRQVKEQAKKSAQKEVAMAKPQKGATKKEETTNVDHSAADAADGEAKVEKESEIIVAVQHRNGSVPGADFVKPSSKNARRRAKKRASVATIEGSRGSAEAGAEKSREEKSESWADEMSKGGGVA